MFWWRAGVIVLRPFDLVLIVACFVTKGFKNGKLNIPLDGALFGMLALLVMGIFSFWWTPDIVRTSVDVIQILELIVFYVLLAIFVRDHSDLEWQHCNF